MSSKKVLCRRNSQHKSCRRKKRPIVGLWKGKSSGTFCPLNKRSPSTFIVLARRFAISDRRPTPLSVFSTILGVAIYMMFNIIPPDGIFSLETKYVDLGSGGLGVLPCKHHIPAHDIHRVKWFKSSRDDVFENGGPALVSWDGITQPYTTDNYGIGKNFSLIIFNMSQSDTGIYCCVVTGRTGGKISKHIVKTIGVNRSAEGSVVNLTAEHGTRLLLPSRYNSSKAKASISNVIWNKRGYKANNFENDDQVIASWMNGEKRTMENYVLNDDFSLEIRNVSFRDTGLYMCLVLATNAKAASVIYVQVTVYALPLGVPVLNVSTLPNTTVVNCSVDYVYPLLYPEFGFHHDKEYSVQNDDGTYNTSISGKAPDNLVNRTVECFFPHFNYTKSSSHQISNNENTPHPSESPVTSRLGLTVCITLGSLLLVLFLLVTTAVWLWKRSTKKSRQNDADIKIAEIEHNGLL